MIVIHEPEVKTEQAIPKTLEIPLVCFDEPVVSEDTGIDTLVHAPRSPSHVLTLQYPMPISPRAGLAFFVR